jgi:phosphohistidine swiveling domain-containing protein
MGFDRMSGEIYLARSKSIAARMLGDEMMVMSSRDSTLFSLNPVASIIWNAADGLTSLNEIVTTRICPAFDVEVNDALRDAETFARELAEHGILLLSEAPIERSGHSPQERK